MTETDAVRAASLIERLKMHYPKMAADVVAGPPVSLNYAINATPRGLRSEDPMPFDPSLLPTKTLVCDIIMKPKETRLLEAAQARGMKVHHGHRMMDAQVPMYLQFFGIPFPDERSIIEISSHA